MEEGRWIQFHTRQKKTWKMKLFLSMNGFFPQENFTLNTNRELGSFVISSYDFHPRIFPWTFPLCGVQCKREKLIIRYLNLRKNSILTYETCKILTNRSNENFLISSPPAIITRASLTTLIMLHFYLSPFLLVFLPPFCLPLLISDTLFDSDQKSGKKTIRNLLQNGKWWKIHFFLLIFSSIRNQTQNMWLLSFVG